MEDVQMEALSTLLEQGKLPIENALSVKLLETIGVPAGLALTVLRSLKGANLLVWGNLLNLTSREKAIEAAGNETAGNAVWDYVQKFNARLSSDDATCKGYLVSFTEACWKLTAGSQSWRRVREEDESRTNNQSSSR
jgi:hypothetical protein